MDSSPVPPSSECFHDRDSLPSSSPPVPSSDAPMLDAAAGLLGLGQDIRCTLSLKKHPLLAHAIGTSHVKKLTRRHSETSSTPRKRARIAEKMDIMRLRKTASLRKASSLRANPVLLSENATPEVKLSADIDDGAKTVPCTPVPAAPLRRDRGPSKITVPLMPDVPIIAPPADYVPSPLLSNASHAKLRLHLLMAREDTLREDDGLQAISAIEPESENTSENDSEDDASSETGSDVTLTSEDSSVYDAQHAQSTLLLWENAAGLGLGMRTEAIDWILHISPVSEYKTDKFDLATHLETNPETRFHAVYLFLRYFYRIHHSSGHSRSHSRSSSQSSTTIYDVDELTDASAVWNTAVASLALSVKFHRDTLHPLYPILADEFCDLAPFDLEYEEYEETQRQILSVFSYRLGVTPQLVLSELWVALRSLRLLLNFASGWEIAQRETWWLLFATLRDPRVLRFPLTVLTAAALSEGLVTTLVKKYDYEGLGGQSRRDAARGRFTFNRLGGKRVKAAKRNAEAVILDIQDVLHISDWTLSECREWMTSLDNSDY